MVGKVGNLLRADHLTALGRRLRPDQRPRVGARGVVVQLTEASPRMGARGRERRVNKTILFASLDRQGEDCELEK